MNKPGRASSHLCSSYSLYCFLGSLLLSSMNLTISRSPLSLLSSPPTITTWTLNKTDNMDNIRRNKTNNINLIEEVIYLVGNRPAVLRLNLLQPSVTAEDEDMGEREVTFHHKPPENLSPKMDTTMFTQITCNGSGTVPSPPPPPPPPPWSRFCLARSPP